MATVYPEINLVSFFNDSLDYDCRSGRVEQGRGGVIDRKRIHFINATKRTYTINATLKDRDDLQTFLEANRGTPFVFRFDGRTKPGLFVAKGWTWNWVVYVAGSGVWKLSLKLEEVFRPGWVPSVLISTGFAGARGFGISLISSAIPSLTIPTGNSRGTGFDPTLFINSSILPLGTGVGAGFDPQLSSQVSISIVLGEATSLGNDPDIREAISVAIPLGLGFSSGEDAAVTPGQATVTISQGFGQGVGINPTITPSGSSIVIDTGASAGTGIDATISQVLVIGVGEAQAIGIDPTITPSEVLVTITLGESVGIGVDPTIVTATDNRVTVTGDTRVTATGDTRVIN